MISSVSLPRALRPAPDSFQAFLVDGAEFTKEEEYPIIPIHFISKEIPKRVVPFNKAITCHHNLQDTFISFYAPDQTFERVRRNPARYVRFFKNTAGIIGLDFSVHSDMPIVKQKAQMNDNLSLTYFFGSQGIPVIPNVRCGVDDLTPEFLSAIPKHSYIAIGTHGFIKEKWQQYDWYCFREEIIPYLSPRGIIVYGSLRNSMFEVFKKQVPFYFYEPWICQRRKRGSRNVF